MNKNLRIRAGLGVALIAIIAVAGHFYFWRPHSRSIESASTAPIDPTFDDLISVLKAAQPTTVAQYLYALKQRFPLYFRAYSLAYHSKSLQHSTYESPRAIVYGDKGDVIIAFNGDPTLPGYGSIETLTFDSVQGLLFRQFTFLSEPQHDTMDAEDIESQYSTAQVKVSQANITRCGDCHGYVDTHVNWDAYFAWPGFYGSNDDNVFRGIQPAFAMQVEGPRPHPYLSVERGMSITSGGDPERNGLLAFAKKLESPNPANRYSVLSDMSTLLGECQYFHSDYTQCTDLLRTQGNFWAQKTLPQDGSSKVDARPNLRLTEILFSHVGADYAKQVMRIPELHKYRFALGAAYACWVAQQIAPTRILSQSLPASVLTWHQKKAGRFDEISDKLKMATYREARILGDRLRSDFQSKIALEYDDIGWEDIIGHVSPESDIYAMLEFLTSPYALSIYDIANNREGLPNFYAGGGQGFEGAFAQTLASGWLTSDGYKAEDFISEFSSDMQKTQAKMGTLCTRLMADSQKALQ